MRTLSTLIKSTIITLLFIIAASLLLVSTSPKSLLTLVPHLTPYRITLATLDIHWLTPTIRATQLEIHTNTNTVLANIENLSLSTTWEALWGNRHHVSGEIKNGTIYADRVIASQRPPSTLSTDKSSDQTSSSNIQKVHELLHLINVNIYDLNIHLEEGQHLAIKQLEKTVLENKWEWITPLIPLNIEVSSALIELHQGTLNDLNSIIRLNTSHNMPTITQHHSGLLYWPTHQATAIEKSLPLSFSANSQWTLLGKTTTGADVNGETSIRINDDTISTTGTINLNGFNDQDFTLHTSVKALPPALDALAPSLFTHTLQQQIAPLFPLNISAKVISDTHNHVHRTQLTNIALTAGESDLNGSITMNMESHPTEKKPVILTGVQFDLHAKKIVLPTVPSTQVNDDSHQTPKGQDTAIRTLFNDEPINIDWINTSPTVGTLAVETLIHNNATTAEGIHANLSAKDNTLKLTTTIKQLAEGSINTDIVLDNTTQPFTLSTQGTIRGLLLESLSLLPKDEFEGGKTNVDFSLASQGLSTHAIASQLQGRFLLETTEGTIANNSFELIGSDLLLNLLNTINPFHKKAKNTQLECAVVNANITEGKIHFDDSLVIRTSKMAVVADGTIDLSTEKINLGINPKARSGVGIDIASLAKFVALKGYISQPSMGVSASGTLKSALNIGAAISTGGLSLIANGLVDKAFSGDMCQRAKKAFTKKETHKTMN